MCHAVLAAESAQTTGDGAANGMAEDVRRRWRRRRTRHGVAAARVAEIWSSVVGIIIGNQSVIVSFSVHSLVLRLFYIPVQCVPGLRWLSCNNLCFPSL